MGGKAIPNSRRVTTTEFHELVKVLTPILQKFYRHVYVPQFLENKETHGDLDFLVCLPIVKNHREAVQEAFQSNERVSCGDTNSYNYQGVQVDVSHPCSRDFIMTCWYKNYGDLSCLIGTMARRIGLIYGMDGLRLILLVKGDQIETDSRQFDNDDNNDEIKTDGYNAEIKLCNDPHRIFEFMGLSIDHYNQGIKDENDLLNFLATSPYFSSEHFYPSVQIRNNHRYRLKRPSYNKIRELAESRKDLPIRKVPTASEIYKVAVKHFNCQKEIDRLQIELTTKMKYKNRFNGELVRQLSHLENQALGKLMIHLKTIYTMEDVLGFSQEEWDNKLKTEINNYLEKLNPTPI